MGHKYSLITVLGNIYCYLILHSMILGANVQVYKQNIAHSRGLVGEKGLAGVEF